MAGHAVADYVVTTSTVLDHDVTIPNGELFILRNDAVLGSLGNPTIWNDTQPLSGGGFTVESGTINGVNLAGAAGFSKTTAGSVILNTVTSYEGHTYVEGGILTISQDDAIRASNGVTVTNGATLNIGNTSQELSFLNIDDGIVTGTSEAFIGSRNGFTVISGTSEVTLGDAENSVGGASLLKVGTGTFYLDAQNTYSGDTVVLEGTLAARRDFAISHLSAVKLAEDTVLDFRETIQGIGSLGDYGDVSWGGEVWLDDGILYTGIDNTDTTFSGSIYGSYSGDIDNIGSGIVKYGTGTWTMNGDIYGLDAIINLEGALFFNGYTDVLLVQNEFDAVFGGNGWIDTWEFQNYGYLVPGTETTPGRLGMSGTFEQGETGNLVIRIHSKDVYSGLDVDGDIYLDGKLTLVAGKGYRPSAGDEFGLIRSRYGIEGNFSKIINKMPRTMLTPRLSIHERTFVPLGDIQMLSPAGFEELVLDFKQEKFGKIRGLNGNQRAVAGAIDSAIRKDRLGKLVDKLNKVDYDRVPAALSLLSPEQLTAIYQIGFANSRTQFNNIERRLDDARHCVTGFSANGLALSGRASDAEGLSLAGFDGKSIVNKNPVAPVVEESRWTFFATGTGEWADIESTREALGSEFSTGGVTVGADYRVNSNLVVGLAGTYVHTGSDLWDGGRIKLDGGKGSVYGTLFNENAYLNAAVGGAYNSYDTRRSTIGGIARGDAQGGEFNALLSGGYDFKGECGYSIGPVASLQYTYIGLNGFHENGSDAALNFPSQHQDSLRTALGVKASYDWSVGGVVVTPEVSAQWAHEYLDSSSAVVSRFVGAGSTFRVRGPKIGRDSLLVNAGASVQINPSWAVFAYYNGELFRTNYSSNSVSGGFRVSF